MALLPILIHPAGPLKQKAQPVRDFDADLRRLVDDMLETMYAAPGIGLAANQVGVLKRVVVIDVAGKDEPAAPMHFINPEIVGESAQIATYEEGCLSIPEIYAEVSRPAEVRVRYQTLDGNTVERDCDGLLATCIQHEIDHLNGVLFVDHLSSLKRNMLLKRLAKLQRDKQRA